MKPISEVYPREAAKIGNDFTPPDDYTPLLTSLCEQVLVRIDAGEYEGDSFVLMRDSARYGVLIFGWGSCSGCDALLGCESIEEVDRLRMGLYDSIKWFNEAEECLRYFETHDWAGDYMWSLTGARDFVEDSTRVLAEIIGGKEGKA